MIKYENGKNCYIFNTVVHYLFTAGLKLSDTMICADCSSIESRWSIFSQSSQLHQSKIWMSVFFWDMRQSLKCATAVKGFILMVLTGLHHLGPLSQPPCSVQPCDIVIGVLVECICLTWSSLHTFLQYCMSIVDMQEKMTQIWLIQVLDM